MRVTSTRFWKQDLGLIRPYTIAGQETTESFNAFFVIELDNGLNGIGGS